MLIAQKGENTMYNMFIVALMVASFIVINPPVSASETMKVAAVEQTQSGDQNQGTDQEEDSDEDEEEEEEVSN